MASLSKALVLVCKLPLARDWIPNLHLKAGLTFDFQPAPFNFQPSIDSTLKIRADSGNIGVGNVSQSPCSTGIIPLGLSLARMEEIDRLVGNLRIFQERRFIGMKTIRDKAYRTTLLSRFEKLSPERRPEWGTLTAHQMVCHLGDQIAVALGDIPSRQTGSILTRIIAKWLILYVMPSAPKGNIRTVPEMLTTEPSDWSEDTKRFVSLLSRLVDEANPSPHPVFGPLSQDQWGILAAKHIHHHLCQFGV